MGLEIKWLPGKGIPRLGTERILFPSLGFFYITRRPLSSYAGHMDTSSRMSAA